MKYQTITYEVSEGIATITINRPEVLNALNLQVLDELLMVAGQASQDTSVKVIIITGSGKSFVAGADIKEMMEFGTHQALAFGDLGHSVMLAFETMDKPVIAAVNGFALGGGLELALACDFIFASTKAKFGQPEVGLGITPGFGGSQRLPRVVGINTARELIFSGEIIDAKRASEIGLVSAVIEPEELMDKVLEKAKQIALKAPIAIASAKRIMNKGCDINLDSALELEKQAFASLFGSDDQTEGMSAFLEKRKADFQNK